MTCDPQELIRMAKCYCFPKKAARQAVIYLLCQWAKTRAG